MFFYIFCLRVVLLYKRVKEGTWDKILSGILSVVVLFFRVGHVICAGYICCYTGELEESIHCVSFPTVCPESEQWWHLLQFTEFVFMDLLGSQHRDH